MSASNAVNPATIAHLIRRRSDDAIPPTAAQLASREQENKLLERAREIKHQQVNLANAFENFSLRATGSVSAYAQKVHWSDRAHKEALGYLTALLSTERVEISNIDPGIATVVRDIFAHEMFNALKAKTKIPVNYTVGQRQYWYLRRMARKLPRS